MECTKKRPKNVDFKRKSLVDSRRACIKDFKEATRNSYDIVDIVENWGTAEYLLKRRFMPQ